MIEINAAFWSNSNFHWLSQFWSWFNSFKYEHLFMILKGSLEDCRNFPFVFNLLFLLLSQIYIPPSTPSGFTHWANKNRWNCSTYLSPDEGLLETDQTQTRISNYGILLSARLFSKETCLYHWRLTKMSQQAITCSKLTIETLEQGWNAFNVNNKDTRTTPMAPMVSLLIALNIFQTLF